MSDPPATIESSDGKTRGRSPLRAAPWLAVAALAALWPWRKKPAVEAKPRCVTPEQFDAAEPGRGRAARYPWAIPARGWKDIAWRTYREFGRARLPALAGGVTFYLLLATFPAVAAFVSLYGLFSSVDTVEHQLVQMSAVFPSDVVDLIGQQMLRLAAQKHGTLGAAFAVSAGVSIWSANAGMKALFDGVNIAYNEVEKRPYLQRTLITYAATFLAIIFLVSVTVIGVAAPVALHRLGLRWAPFRWIVIYLVAAFAFTLVYRFGPSRAPAKWRWVTLGGLAAALIWMAGSLSFSWYLNNFTHLGVTYGSLGAMIGFMLWVWFSVMVVLVGAELSAEIEHQTAQDTTTGRPLPIGARGAAMADSVGPAFTVSAPEAVEITRAFLGRQVDYVVNFFRRLARV